MKSENEVISKKAHSTEKFIKEVNTLVERHGLDYMDAIVHYCEKNNLEIESVASIIRSNSKIKAKLQNEAEVLNFLPKTSRLPI